MTPGSLPRSGDGGGIDRRAIPPEAIETHHRAADGHLVRRIDWRMPGDPCGSLMFLPGRGDAYEKYLETLDHWHRRAWSVTAADWRGQGGSGRLCEDGSTGHIDEFATWIDDLAGLWTRWRAQSPAPHVVIGHSMGGHLALRALAERRIDADAAVLIAPMLGLGPARVPRALLHQVARMMCRVGNRRRPAWRTNERPGVLPGSRQDLLTHDAARYADEQWWRRARPELALGPPSWGWIERAYASIGTLEPSGVLERVDIPVLLLATSADRLVSYPAIARAARRLPRCELVRFGPEARHEILRESDPVRDRALAAIDDFLDRAAPPAT